MKNARPRTDRAVTKKVIAGQVQEVKRYIQKDVGKVTGDDRSGSSTSPSRSIRSAATSCAAVRVDLSP